MVEVRAQQASKPLPDRVLVYGVTGSGKSTAAVAIGARAGLPVTLVDELTWLPGWVPVEESRQRELIEEIVVGERWLLDSSYGAWLDLVLPRAQLVVGLDYPRWLSLGRLVRRTVSGAITQQPRCNGNVETWRALLSRRSIIRWHFQSFARKRARMRAWAASSDGPEVLLFRRPRELEAWLAGLGGSG
jgi:adenylate kinase family enzyme